MDLLKFLWALNFLSLCCEICREGLGVFWGLYRVLRGLGGLGVFEDFGIQGFMALRL